MRLRTKGALALATAALLTTTSSATEERPIEPLADTSFRSIEAPTPTPSPAPIAEPDRRSVSPPPRVNPTTKPKIALVSPTPKPVPLDQVSGKRWGVVEGSRIARAYARTKLNASQYDCLNKLWIRESGWRWNALNRWSGAYGIPQALPGSKMRTAGADWKTNPITQVRWGLRYISGRYGRPCAAWAFFQAKGWY